MPNDTDPFDHDPARRRRFLRLFGTAAALLPITMITGCSDDRPAPPPATPVDEPESTNGQEQSAESQPASESGTEPQSEPEAQAEPESNAGQRSSETAGRQSAEDMPRLSLDDPTAQSLGYKHDAANVDPQKFPQRGENELCKNCTLFQASADKQWGPCTLFPGRRVNANGWCSGYTPKAG
jgi:hypothetical protein